MVLRRSVFYVVDVLSSVKMSDVDSTLRERLERTRREAEYSKKKLQQQHEESIEEHETAKKLLERKVCVDFK